LAANTSGSTNTAVGGLALATNTSSSLNTAVGYNAMNANNGGVENSALGVSALALNITGNYNTAIGRSSLQSNTTASNNTAVGYQAGYANTTGTQNVFIGQQAGYNRTTGVQNTCVGASSGFTGTTAAGNTFIGYGAGYYSTGTYNTFVGCGPTNSAGDSMTTGTKNTIIGAYGGNQGGLDIRTASNYIVLSDGDGNPRGVFDSSGNLGLGVTPSGNYLLEVKGKIAARRTGDTIEHYIAIHNSSSQTYVESINNYAASYLPINFKQTHTGSSQTAMTLDASGNLLMGMAATVGGARMSVQPASATGVGIETNGSSGYYPMWFQVAGAQKGYITTTTGGTTYNTTSDYRLKENIKPMTGALAKVAQLKPCTYVWKETGDSGQGFIAHELAEVVPECVSGEKDGTYEQSYEVSPAVKDEQGNIVTPAEIGTQTVPFYQGVDTSNLVATLTAAIQEQQAIITALTTRITALEAK
jgi:hypothetical protein